jgi:Ca-activated chloride channel family protein
MSPFMEYPWVLAIVPLLATAIVLLVYVASRRRARRLHRLGSDTVVARLLPAAVRAWWHRATLLGLAVACAGVGFAGPRWGTEQLEQRANGVDVVLALDASLSMLATDERPNRLTRMKEETRRLLDLASGDRFGLIAFAGRSYILSPITADQGGLDLFLDNLDPSVVGEAGSSMARAIRQGTDLLAASQTGADKALVIMSDGEAFEPLDDIVAAAKRAADAGIRVIAVGFGTTVGSTIPIISAQGTTLKRDVAGQIVVTRYTPATLQAAADAAGGVFISASATDKAARVRNALAGLHGQGGVTSAGRDRKPRFQLFLIPALLLLLADTVLAERRGRRRAAPAAARTVAAALLMMLVLPHALLAEGGADGDRLYRAGRYAEAAAAYAQEIRNGDSSPRTLYNYGTALLAAGRSAPAAEALDRAASIARDADLRYRALFNLGLLHLRAGLATKGDTASREFSAAVEAYKSALRLRPSELDAKWNYELANRRKKETTGGGGGGGGTGRPQPQRPNPSTAAQLSRQPTGGLDQREAEAILNSAAREERDVQAAKQKANQPTQPPGGKDW